tara:strand:- start:202 stop:618 length:417 start_codon:yes stop_codon:yes gene_type:complete
MDIKSTDIRSGRHCVFNMHCHLVFVTKYRKKVFTKTILSSVQNHFERICADFEVELKAFDGEDNHVHLLVEYHPKVTISKLVNSLKGVSSRFLKQEFLELEKYYWKGSLWSPSYFSSSCGGAPIDIIRQYIEQQNTPD